MVMDTLAKLPQDVALDDIPSQVWGYSPLKNSFSLTVRDALSLRYLFYRQFHENRKRMWRELNTVFAAETKYKPTDPGDGYEV
jgi:hypothetical protein